MSEGKVGVNYLKVISSLYLDKRLRLVKSSKDFVINEHDGIVHKNHLYLRSNKLMSHIRSLDNTAELNNVLNYLDSQGALHTGKDSKSRKIAGSKLRFYVLRIAKLQ